MNITNDSAPNSADGAIQAEFYSKQDVKRLVEARKKDVLSSLLSTATTPTTPTTILVEENDSLKRPWQAMLPHAVKLPSKPYPVEALPPLIREAVLEVQAYTQTPMALVANSALVSLVTACQAHFDVARDDNLKAPVSLFFVTIAESGERKTTCDHFFSKILLEYQTRVAKEMAPEMNEFHAEAAAWTAKEEGIKSAIKRSIAGLKSPRSIQDLQGELQQLHLTKPQKPRVPSIVRTDDTSENLAYVLTHEWPSAGIVSSEGGLLFASRALKKDNVTATLALYNVLWDGGEYQIGRKTGDSFTVRGARLSIGVQVQPEVMQNFLEGSENVARGIGFMARCLFSFPDSTQGQRPYKNAPKQMQCLDEFNALIMKILTLEPRIDDGQLMPSTLPLSEKAKEIWIAFHDLIESQLALGGQYENLRDIASKIADNASRIAANFAITAGFPLTQVDSESMKRGCSIAEWYLFEALRYFGKETPSQKKVSENARTLEKWLICEAAKTQSKAVVKRKCMQYGPNPTTKSAHLIEAVDFLQERNRARFSNDKRFIELHPDLLVPSSNNSNQTEEGG